MIFFNELYAGDIQLHMAQEYLSKFRQKYIGKAYNNHKMHTDDNLLKFSREIEKIFGFSVFSLVLNETEIINAFTIPLGSRLGIGNVNSGLSVNSKQGMQFDSSDKYVCIVVINTGLLISKKITDREVMAIILHEIGHNFNANVLKHGTIYSIYTQITNTIATIISPLLYLNPDLQMNCMQYGTMSTYGAKKYADNLEYEKMHKKKLYQEFQKTNAIISTLGYTSIFIIQLVMAISTPIKFITMVFMKKAISILLNFDFGVSYKNEKLSDAFVTIYGYGPDLASAFCKFDGYVDKVTDDMYKATIFNNCYSLIILPYLALMEFLDPHPNAATRIKEQMDYLEKELDSENLDPKLKKELKNQYKDLKKQINLMFDPKHYYPGNEVIKNYRKWLYDNFAGDFKELFVKKYETYDNYNRVETKYKD